MKKPHTIFKFLNFIIFTLPAALALSSCGDYFEFPANEAVTAGEMRLGRKVIPLVVGDSYNIPVEFSPAELSNNAVYWRSMDDAIATFHNGTLVGMAEGMTRAYAFSTIDRLRDTCVVCVLPDFYVAPGNYPYDMVVYASVNLHGTMLTTDNANSVVIGAYVGDQLRGVGKMQRHHDTDYLLLRIWSPYSYGEELSLRCYYRGQARAEVFPDVIVFDGEHLGTLSNLYPLVLDENAQEYLPDADFGEDNPYIIGTDTTHVVIYD